jgi:hypothetical protein
MLSRALREQRRLKRRQRLPPLLDRPLELQHRQPALLDQLQEHLHQQQELPDRQQGLLHRPQEEQRQPRQHHQRALQPFQLRQQQQHRLSELIASLN